MRVVLKKNYFTDKEKLFLTMKDIQVSIFRYETGIEALRIKNERGYIIVLPFKGQLIWEAVFDGRELNMYRINKKEPKPSNFYLDSAFGSYFFHAGAMAVGNPGEGDTHPLHGELPYADYEEAELIIDENEQNAYVGLTGLFAYNRGFGPCYEARPVMKMYGNSSLLDITMRIDNISNYPMEFMYLFHVNTRPVDNSRIVQCNPWTPEAMPARGQPLGGKVPGQDDRSDDFDDLNARIKENPRLTEFIRPGDIYKPEVGFYLEAPRTDAEGWTRIMMVLDDGTADFIKYKPSELDHAMRWLCKTADQEGMGMAFPATCGVEGYTMEKKLGHVRKLPSKGTFESTITIGSLNKEDATKEEGTINEIMDGIKE